MLKILRLSFALESTYRVNGILHSLKQIPLLKQALPATLYKVRGLKIFANVLSVLWEIVFIFLGKFLYFLTMVCGVGLLYERAPAGLGFLHILLFLTLIFLRYFFLTRQQLQELGIEVSEEETQEENSEK